MDRKRILLISIDGMRPDGLEAAHTPHMDRLRREGSYTDRARTVMPSVTLPCHMSMLRGVDPSRHGIVTNTFHPLVRHVPSLLESAWDVGKRTGFIYNWEELRDLTPPGKLNISIMHNDCDSPEGDHRVVDFVLSVLEPMDLDVLFVYLGWTDSCAHMHGWMSDPYLEAVSNADACIGRLLDGLASVGRAEETVTVVLADHGGHGRSHGTDMDEDMLIPWLIHGPGIKKGYTIDAPVRIYDTCVTLTRLIGAPLHPEWDGRVVEEVLA